MRICRVGLAQINTTVGDIEGNVASIHRRLHEARELECAIFAVPELAVTGYPPEDLLLRRSFCVASRDAVEALAPETHGLVAVIGFVDWF
ncbi:MAG: NAD+ synthase, partial [Dehalococcoidia bacterium]|nr:NAD+ synthase [Dehalococcoidia bacterium]